MEWPLRSLADLAREICSACHAGNVAYCDLGQIADFEEYFRQPIAMCALEDPGGHDGVARPCRVRRVERNLVSPKTSPSIRLTTASTASIPEPGK